WSRRRPSARPEWSTPRSENNCHESADLTTHRSKVQHRKVDRDSTEDTAGLRRGPAARSDREVRPRVCGGSTAWSTAGLRRGPPRGPRRGPWRGRCVRVLGAFVHGSAAFPAGRWVSRAQRRGLSGGLRRFVHGSAGWSRKIWPSCAQRWKGWRGAGEASGACGRRPAPALAGEVGVHRGVRGEVPGG
ncbi:MAG: hypothetical protein QOG10_1494, partial [Kribbellaceae bacterium]|nr:hypothetical protein [Kribbellaceae bacterium]